MADFAQALKYTLRFEDSTLSGKITYDTGGTTRFGISEKSNPEAFPQLTECDVETALQLAGNIYRAKYWCFDGVNSQIIANKLFDLAVNMGPGTAILLAQKCVGTAQDGKLGPTTLQAINDATAGLLTCLRASAAQHYRDLAAQNPDKYAKYLKDWLVRANA